MKIKQKEIEERKKRYEAKLNKMKHSHDEKVTNILKTWQKTLNPAYLKPYEIKGEKIEILRLDLLKEDNVDFVE